MNWSSECPLTHRSTSSSTCGPGDTLTARPGTGFGTSATSFSSTLSGTATSALDGTLVECFGPANNVNLENRVDSSNIQILGQYVFTHCECIYILTCDSNISAPEEWKFVYDVVTIQLRWHGSHSAEVNENINLGYSHDQGYS